MNYTKPYFKRFGSFGVMNVLECVLSSPPARPSVPPHDEAQTVPTGIQAPTSRTHRRQHVAIIGAGPNALRLLACLHPHSAHVVATAFEAEKIGSTISNWCMPNLQNPPNPRL